MVAGELPHLAREARRAVREENLDLRETPGVEEELARGRVRVRVLRIQFEVELEAHGDPGGLAAPARLDELALEREEPAQGSDRIRGRLLLEARLRLAFARRG